MQIQENISLLPYNTFGINTTASYFCIIRSREDLVQLIHQPLTSYGKYLFIGGGSNILLCNDYDGLVIKNEIQGIDIVKEDDEHIWLRSYSGTVWHALVMYCVQHHYGGIENMSLIPGTVGAAPMQNIGAYGVELKDVFEELEAIDLQTASTKIFTKEQCQFGYRESIFKKAAQGKFFIYAVTLRLSKRPVINTAYGDIQKVLAQKGIIHPDIKDISDAVIEIRQSKLPDPKTLGNAGSFFKNPEVDKLQAERLQLLYPDMPAYDLPNGKVKVPAGWLIEQCGWKGKQIGHTGSHAKQALVIVNYGNASGSEIWQHALNVQQSVQEKFGINIEPEVNIIK